MASIGDKIFGYSKRELEHKAEEFIRRRPFIGNSPPVYADLILLRMPDVARIEPGPTLLVTHKTEAMVLVPRFMHRELTVVIDQQIMDSRDGAPYNMALAEEIGHIELHRSVMLEIEDPAVFLILQRHHRWSIAEHDAKFFARAILMPGVMLESVASKTYERVANEVGFGDAFQFERMFTVHLASAFEVPVADAQNRIDAYFGGLRSRLDRSIAAGASSLLTLTDQVEVKTYKQVSYLDQWGREPTKSAPTDNLRSTTAF